MNKTEAKFRHAEILVKQYGAEIAADNRKKGKEYLFITCDNEEKLTLLEEALKKDGWYIWPPTEETEGWVIECSLYPPKVQKKDKNTVYPPARECGNTFTYRGFTSDAADVPVFFFGMGSIIFFGLYFGFIVIDVESILSSLNDPSNAIIAYSVGLMVILVMLLLHQSIITFVHADTNGISAKRGIVSFTYRATWKEVKSVYVWKNFKKTLFLSDYAVVLTRKNGSEIYARVPRKHLKTLEAFAKKQISKQ